MNGVRVLRVYHSAVVSEYRTRDRLLRSRHGYDLRLVSPPIWSEGGRDVSITLKGDDLPVDVVPTRGRRHPILFWYETSAFGRLLREFRPHIVDLHEEPYSLAVAAAIEQVRRHAPDASVSVYTAQNIYKRYPPPFRQLERRALARAACAYPCSTEAGDVLRSKGFAGNLHVIPLGVTTQHRPPRRSSAPFTVGLVGRLEPYKGGTVAVRALERLSDLDVRLEIVGDGSERESLAELASDLGIASRVTFTGAVPQDEALQRIASFDAVIVPSLTTASWKEQFGRIAAQALEAGTPVVASDSGSLREVLGDCGVLVPEGDVAAIANGLRQILSDPAQALDLSERGRKRAAAWLSWEKVSDDFDQMYRGMLDQAAEAGQRAP